MLPASKMGHFPDFESLEVEFLTDSEASHLNVRVLRFVARLFAKSECSMEDLDAKLLSILLRSDHKLGLDYACDKPYSIIKNILIKSWIPYH